MMSYPKPPRSERQDPFLCSTHSKEFELFCEDCKSLFCSDCEGHKSHTSKPVEEAASFYRDKFTERLGLIIEGTKRNKQRIEIGISSLNKEEVIVSEEIQFAAWKLQEFLEERKVVLQDKVASILWSQFKRYKEDLTEFLSQVENLQKFYSEITSTSNIGDSGRSSSTSTKGNNISDDHLKLLENASQILQQMNHLLNADLIINNINPNSFKLHLPEEHSFKELIASFGEIVVDEISRDRSVCENESA